jgi:hypothetical protein
MSVVGSLAKQMTSGTRVYIEASPQYLIEVDSDRILRLNLPREPPALFEKCSVRFGAGSRTGLGEEVLWSTRAGGPQLGGLRTAPLR